MLTFNTISSISNIERVTYLLTIHFMYIYANATTIARMCAHAGNNPFYTSFRDSSSTIPYYTIRTAFTLAIVGWRCASCLFTANDPQKIHTLPFGINPQSFSLLLVYCSVAYRTQILITKIYVTSTFVRRRWTLFAGLTVWWKTSDRNALPHS